MYIRTHAHCLIQEFSVKYVYVRMLFCWRDCQKRSYVYPLLVNFRHRCLLLFIVPCLLEEAIRVCVHCVGNDAGVCAHV